MSIEPDPSLPSRPHIVVVGNHKGGSGKLIVNGKQVGAAFRIENDETKPIFRPEAE